MKINFSFQIECAFFCSQIIPGWGKSSFYPVGYFKTGDINQILEAREPDRVSGIR